MNPLVLFFAIALSIVFGGCGLPGQPAPAKSFVMLADRPDATRTVQLAECLRVRVVRAAAPFNGTALVYRTGQTVFEKDYYNAFIAAPDQQIGDLLAVRLKAAGAMICPNEIRAPKRLTLEPHLEALYADFTAPTAPFAVAKMRFVLTTYDASCRCGSIVFDHTFEATAALPPKPNAEAVAEAMSDAVGQVLGQALDRLE